MGGFWALSPTANHRPACYNRGMATLPPEISSDIGQLLHDLANLGFAPTGFRYSPEHFGNYFIDLRGTHEMRIVRDRSQYTVDILGIDLEAAGLRHAFNDPNVFSEKLLSWVKSIAQ